MSLTAAKSQVVTFCTVLADALATSRVDLGLNAGAAASVIRDAAVEHFAGRPALASLPTLLARLCGIEADAAMAAADEKEARRMVATALVAEACDINALTAARFAAVKADKRTDWRSGMANVKAAAAAAASPAGIKRAEERRAATQAAIKRAAAAV